MTHKIHELYFFISDVIIATRVIIYLTWRGVHMHAWLIQKGNTESQKVKEMQYKIFM